MSYDSASYENAVKVWTVVSNSHLGPFGESPCCDLGVPGWETLKADQEIFDFWVALSRSVWSDASTRAKAMVDPIIAMTGSQFSFTMPSVRNDVFKDMIDKTVPFMIEKIKTHTESKTFCESSKSTFEGALEGLESLISAEASGLEWYDWISIIDHIAEVGSWVHLRDDAMDEEDTDEMLSQVATNLALALLKVNGQGASLLSVVHKRAGLL